MLTNPMQTVARDHDRISENRFPGKHRNDFRHERKAGNNQDVDLGMAEDPKEVHPQHGGAAGLRIEEMAAQISIDQQHHLCRG